MKATNTQHTTTPNIGTPAEIITAQNVQAIGERIAVKFLKTLYTKSGDETIGKLYSGLVRDICHHPEHKETYSDGYDVAQTACAYLCGYIGQPLTAPALDGTQDKSGNPATILRACFRSCRAYVYAHTQKHYKCLYLENVEESKFIQVPFEWDTPTIADYSGVKTVIQGLNLTAKQSQILAYRMRGKSLHEVAKILSIHRKTLQEHIQAIQRKYNTYETQVQ